MSSRPSVHALSWLWIISFFFILAWCFGVEVIPFDVVPVRDQIFFKKNLQESTVSCNCLVWVTFPSISEKLKNKSFDVCFFQDTEEQNLL